MRPAARVGGCCSVFQISPAMPGAMRPGTISWRTPIGPGPGETVTASLCWRSPSCGSLEKSHRNGWIPRRMFDAVERNPLLGERRLLLAVLEEAIRTYQRYALANDHRSVTLFSHVEEWFASEDSEWMFSFVAICDALGLETTFLRAGLRRLRDDQTGPLLARCRSRGVSGRRHRIARQARAEPGDRRAPLPVIVRTNDSSSPAVSDSGAPAVEERGRRSRTHGRTATRRARPPR